MLRQDRRPAAETEADWLLETERSRWHVFARFGERNKSCPLGINHQSVSILALIFHKNKKGLGNNISPAMKTQLYDRTKLSQF